MNGKEIFFKSFILFLRLIFHTFSFVVMYFVLRDNIFLKINYSDQDYNWSLSTAWAIAQIFYWTLTLHLESNTMKIISNTWSNAEFQSKRAKIKTGIFVYVFVIISTIYSTIDCHRYPDDHQIFSSNTEKDDSNLPFMLYCTECILSIGLYIFAYFIYRRRTDPHGFARNGQRILQNLLQNQMPNLIAARQQQEAAANRQYQPISQQQQQQQQPRPNNFPAPAPPVAPSVVPQAQPQRSRFSMSYSIAGIEAQKEYNSECVICLGDLLPDERVIELPCLHAYHSQCIRSNPQNLCPMCRRPY